MKIDRDASLHKHHQSQSHFFANPSPKKAPKEARVPKPSTSHVSATQRVSPNFPRKQLPKPERANPFCPRLWLPTPCQGAEESTFIIPRLRTSGMSFQVHPSTSKRNFCQGLQTHKWMDSLTSSLPSNLYSLIPRIGVPGYTAQYWRRTSSDPAPSPIGCEPIHEAGETGL